MPDFRGVNSVNMLQKKIDLEMEDSFIVLVVLFTLQVVISLDVPTLSLPSFIQEGQELSFKCRYRIQESKIPEVDIKVCDESQTTQYVVRVADLRSPMVFRSWTVNASF